MNFYHTQNNFMEKSNSVDFSKTYFKGTFYNTLKNQNTNYSTFQKSNIIDTINVQNIYNILKLQYTLVHDFLIKINLSYTAEVFNSEIKSIFYPTTPYTKEEISTIIELNKPDSDFENTLNSNPFLSILKNTYLYNLIYSKTDILKEEKEVQITSDFFEEKNDSDNTTVKKNNFLKISNEDYMKNLDKELEKIDQKYDKKLKKENLNPKINLTEGRFIQYKKELENQYKEDLKNEIERIKSVEVSKILIEENQKYQNKIESIRNEYETNYLLKLKELNEKEKIINDKKSDLEDVYITKNRELIENYKQKINNLSEKESNFNKKCIKELNGLKEQKKTLDRKERELNFLKQEYYKEISKEVEAIKIECKQILKEQIQKLKYENEQELEKAKNKLKLKGMNYSLNISMVKDLNVTKDKENYFKEIISLKEELSNIKSKIKVNNILLSDNESQIINNNLNYYEQISNLESKLNEIINKTNFKFYNNINKKEEESEIIIKDDKIQKKLEELENEQNEINKLFEKELKNMAEETEKVLNIELNKEEIEKIKRDKYDMVLYKLAKDKELNEIYKKESEQERIKNKLKYINEINENARKLYEKQINKEKYIVIDKNEMDRYKELYYKLYKQKREQKKIDEINRQKELKRQRELKEKEIKEREEKEKERRQKSRDKKEEEKNLFSKSFQLPPVRNPKERKSSALDSIGEFILPKKEIEEKQEKPQKSMNEEDEYGSGDFIDISKVDNKSRTKSKIDISKKEISGDAELSGRIDMILNETHTDKISESINKENSESYNDFETSNALDLKGINTLNTD